MYLCCTEISVVEMDLIVNVSTGKRGGSAGEMRHKGLPISLLQIQ